MIFNYMTRFEFDVFSPLYYEMNYEEYSKKMESKEEYERREKLFSKRKIMITTNIGVVLIEGNTSLNDKELLEIFNTKRYGIFIYEGTKCERLDLKIKNKNT